MVNYYELLGIERNSSLEEIQKVIKAERKKVRKRTNHPDTKIRHEAELLIEQLSEAERIFQDDDSRFKYDNQLTESSNKNDQIDNHDKVDEVSKQFKKVQRYLDRGQIELAKRALSEIDIVSPIAMRLKGEVLLKLGDVTDGIYELDKYIESDSGNPQLYFEVSDILYEIGRNQEALQYLDEVSEEVTGYPLYSRLGNIYANMEKYDNAIENFNKIDTNSNQINSSYINYCLAFCYNRKQQYMKAIEYANKALNGNLENASATYEKILSYDKLGKLIEIENLVEESYIKYSNSDVFNYYVLKIRVYRHSMGMTKIRTNNLSVLSTFNNLDYIVASKADLIKAEDLYRNIAPLAQYDESGIVNKEIQYLQNQIQYAQKVEKKDIGKWKWVMLAMALYIFNLPSVSDTIKLLFVSLIGVSYYKLTNVPGYMINRKRNRNNIVKE